MEKEKVCPINKGTTTKKKKKTKRDLFPSTDDALNGLKVDDLTKKIRDKKKMDTEKHEVKPFTNENELVTEDSQKEKRKKKKLSVDENETIQPEVTKKEEKSLKKRKMSVSNENENLSAEMTISEDLKCHKTRTSKEESSIKEEMSAQETSNKQLDKETNVKLETDGVKSKKKRRHAIAEVYHRIILNFNIFKVKWASQMGLVNGSKWLICFFIFEISFWPGLA